MHNIGFAYFCKGDGASAVKYFVSSYSMLHDEESFIGMTISKLMSNAYDPLSVNNDFTDYKNTNKDKFNQPYGNILVLTNYILLMKAQKETEAIIELNSFIGRNPIDKTEAIKIKKGTAAYDEYIDEACRILCNSIWTMKPYANAILQYRSSAPDHLLECKTSQMALEKK